MTNPDFRLELTETDRLYLKLTDRLPKLPNFDYRQLLIDNLIGLA